MTTLRPARPSDVAAMLRLMVPHVASEDLLPRDEADVAARLHEFVLLEDEAEGGPPEVVGIAALHHYGAGLAEVRSLAVAPAHAGNGFGRRLVEALLERAREERLSRVIALTRSPGFFERLGFAATRLEVLPEKVQADCLRCPRRSRCDETAVVMDLG